MYEQKAYQAKATAGPHNSAFLKSCFGNKSYEIGSFITMAVRKEIIIL